MRQINHNKISVCRNNKLQFTERGIKNEKMDDILGKTATESLENCCKEINDHEFDELWKKITDRHKLII